MINTIDIGQEKKLHPTNKKDFGERLANIVLANEYKKSIATNYPVYETHSLEKNKVIVSFKNADF